MRTDGVYVLSGELRVRHHLQPITNGTKLESPTFQIPAQTEGLKAGEYTSTQEDVLPLKTRHWCLRSPQLSEPRGGYQMTPTTQTTPTTEL